jgi:hypothetical protein
LDFFSIFFIIFLEKNDFFIKNGYILDIFPKEAVWVNYYCVKWEFYGLFSVFVLGAGHQNPYTATTATVRHCQYYCHWIHIFLDRSVSPNSRLRPDSRSSCWRQLPPPLPTKRADFQHLNSDVVAHHQ